MVVHIFGAAGSGTTTLAKAYAKKHGYTHLDVDDFYWKDTLIPFTVSRPKEERVRLLKEKIEKCENCVVSGAVCVWGDELIPYFDIVVKLETPTDVRIKRLRDREKLRFGARIEEGGDMYHNHLRFIEWASVYDNGGVEVRSNLLHNHWLRKIHSKVYVLDGTLPVDELLEKIEQ